MADVSDHLPIFGNNNVTRNKKELPPYMVRHFKAFNLDPTKRFVSIFNKIVNKYAPLRSATRKEKRRFNKPWLTNGILNSIKYKHRLYAKFIKTKTPESL